MDCDDRTLRMNPTEMKQHDICVVGGAGHVGLPLSIVFASKNRRVLIYDLNIELMNTIRSGRPGSAVRITLAGNGVSGSGQRTVPSSAT